ncbi:hypothetical protein SHPE106448_10835 [Shewanella pealeana]
MVSKSVLNEYGLHSSKMGYLLETRIENKGFHPVYLYIPRKYPAHFWHVINKFLVYPHKL